MKKNHSDENHIPEVKKGQNSSFRSIPKKTHQVTLSLQYHPRKEKGKPLCFK